MLGLCTIKETVMKILAINGSHRAGKGTASLIEAAFEEARALGCETELVELSKCNIEYCIGCNRCLGKPECTVQDGMQELYEKMKAADGIILGAEQVEPEIVGYAQSLGLPVLPFSRQALEDGSYVDAYCGFYDEL